MRADVEIIELGHAGPRILLLPGLGARGSGFRRLADALARDHRPILVEYPEGAHAHEGPGALALRLAAIAGPCDAAVASSYGGLVAAHLGARGHLRGLAFLGSFTHLEQLGVRGRLIAAMGPIAVFGKPGWGAATIAAHGKVARELVAHIVPTTPLERETVRARANGLRLEGPPPPLRNLPLSCLALQGTRDWLVPPATLPRLLAALPPGSYGEYLDGAGHVPYLTHPERCAQAVRAWLAKLPATA